MKPSRLFPLIAAIVLLPSAFADSIDMDNPRRTVGREDNVRPVLALAGTPKSLLRMRDCIARRLERLHEHVRVVHCIALPTRHGIEAKPEFLGRLRTNAG